MTRLKRSAIPNTIQMSVFALLSAHGVLDLYTNTIVTSNRTAWAAEKNTERYGPALANLIAIKMSVNTKPKIQRSATDL